MNLLQRLDDGSSRVNRVWNGPVACIAGGESLTQQQVDWCRGRARVIVVNDGYRIAPWADVLYFADGKWHAWHKNKPEYRAFAGEKCSLTCNTSVKSEPAVHRLIVGGTDGLSTDARHINTGRNGGHQAINIAFLAGGNPILLLGYDGKGGHWFGDHPDKTCPPFSIVKSAAKTIVPVLRAHGVRIINCTPGSALDCFESATIESVLPDQAAAPLPAGGISCGADGGRLHRNDAGGEQGHVG